MKRYVALLLVGSLVLGSCNKSMPISEQTATVSTALVTACAAVGTVLLAKLNKMDRLQSILFIGGLTAFFYACAKTIFFSITSCGRIERARNLIAYIKEQPLLHVCIAGYDSDDLLIYRLYEEYFESPLPLIDAFEHLVYIRYLIDCSESLLTDAKAEGVEYRVVECYCECCQELEEYKAAVDYALVIIKQHPSWISALNANAFQGTVESGKALVDVENI